MKTYLSHGGGVNSTALMLLLEKEGVEFESVFVDHGGDYPETYDYIKYLQKLGHLITIIKPNVSGCSTIEEYCLKYKTLPSVQVRWCTGKFKITPLANYYEKPCVEFIGFSADEKRRADRYQNTTWKRWKKRIDVKFPLVEQRITRRDCIKIIRSADLRIPPRSGCWFCPFASIREIRKLYAEHPELYVRMKKMEESTGRNFTFSSKGSLSSIVAEDTSRLDKFCEGATK